MIALASMNSTEYEQFLELANEDYINNQITAGNWTTENAPQKMAQTLEQYLPNGFNTPNHHFYNILTPDRKTCVGSLWYFVNRQSEQPQIYVLYVYIQEKFRRQGYGTQVFQIVEERAKQLDISQIALSVFPHNAPARSMYQKIGFTYLNSDHYMVKNLEISASNLHN